ncbi:MAG TPA: hypothetical protein VEW26_15840, partial [Allosphingosinicella sp.]|nr:hypothetical protein [Allosphingosinicella sp.]
MRMAGALLAATSWPALAADVEEQPAPVAEDNVAIPAPSANEVDQAQAAAELRELQAMRQEMQRKMGDFDARIEALESRLGVAHPPPSSPVVTAGEAITTDPGVEAPAETGEKTQWGKYEPGRGFILVRGEQGELGSGVYAYARFLNQKGLEETYTDSFGRVKPLQDIRSDLQFQKLSWNFKGWLFDPDFRYYFFFWTSNPQMGEGAQVVLGGYFQYRFSDLITVTAGVMPLPTTRTTNYTFPNWLRNDNRVMADEFFRGSYSTGIDAQGEITRGLRYRVAIANNLAQLGVSSQELDASFNTFSGALWWMPTTGEFGQASGFGD